MSTALRVIAVRYQCPHCARTRAKKAATEAHIARCWHNPDNRGCKTCEYYLPAGDGSQCIPGDQCTCNVHPESCNADAAPDSLLPLINCPQWSAAYTVTSPTGEHR